MYSASLIKKYRKHRLLSIDPGTTTMGISVYEIDHYTGDYQLLMLDTVFIERYISHVPLLRYLASSQTLLSAKLEAVSQIVCDLCKRYEIEQVVCEDIYFQHISSHRTMSEGLHAIRVGVMRYDPAIELEMIPPREVKGGVGVPKNSSDKELMRGAVKERLANKLAEGIDLDSVTEHAIDASAIGYYWITHSSNLKGISAAFATNR